MLAFIRYLLLMLVAGLLIEYGYSKLGQPEDLERVIEAYQVFNHQMISVIARVLPFIEVFLGVAILSPARLGYLARWATVILFCSFTTLLFRGLWIGLSECGCGGSLAFNPLEFGAKFVWSLGGGELPSIVPSIIRNLLSLSILAECLRAQSQRSDAQAATQADAVS